MESSISLFPGINNPTKSPEAETPRDSSYQASLFIQKQRLTQDYPDSLTKENNCNVSLFQALAGRFPPRPFQFHEIFTPSENLNKHYVRPLGFCPGLKLIKFTHEMETKYLICFFQTHCKCIRCYRLH